MQYPADFITHYGSVYFDDDVDTSLFSVPLFRGCDEVLQADHNVSGIYTIFPAGFNDGLQVYCDMETDGGGWIVIQRRLDGSVDFYRNWADYQVGFGSLSGEFWLGNDNLRSLTETEGKWRLRIDLEDWENNTAWAEYDDFQIHGDNYVLQVNSYNTNSTAGDSLIRPHNGMMFSSKDKDNDNHDDESCAILRKDCCGNLQLTFIAADNRALTTSTFREDQIKSAVRCVSYCHADNNCRSVNYHKTDQLCQMNNLTRMQNPDDFITHYGSVYFDDDVYTSLFSVPQFRGCDEVLQAGHNVSGIYTIFPAGFNDALQVYCDMENDGGGWIVIQRRQDGSVDFNRNWADYQFGFGSLSGEFWLGNDNLRSLTETKGKWQLRIDLEDWENNTAWAEYDDFQIHGNDYILRVNSYNTNSTAKDSLQTHSGMMFSTKDKDNDKIRKSCAILRTGAWWYTNCYRSNLNGRFGQGNDVRDQLCQMNNLTRMQNPADFITHYGSVYFDDDVDTSLFSVPQFRGCDEVLQAGHKVSGIYTIFPAGFNDGLQVCCDMETDGGGWIVIQRRQDGSVDFYRNWTDYQVGFGSLSGEFWLGNDNLRSLTETEGRSSG
ncbi:uncharacterized protein LOC119730000 [Patiria miniata]|uniref:Fibrinogen C-terminal domain-containing protein n=1 Tax=Patiria miniata TaxID=46514 RepID=A0A914A5B9_PATMI|nr:uncharacterized protein LOC119730000 [Patiria miniata]